MSVEQKETRSFEEVVNITSGADNEISKSLSNFAPTPFELDGKKYATVEGFWQGLYFSEGSVDREMIAQMSGREAKKAGRKRLEGISEIVYEGQSIKIGSEEHHQLMRKAITAKLEQNSDVLKLLLETGNKKLTHILIGREGNILPDSKSIPAAIFTSILMDLREEFRPKKTETAD